MSGTAGGLIDLAHVDGGAAGRRNAQSRASTLLIAFGVLTICLAAPATLVGAQAPAPDADAGQAVTPQEPAEPPAPQPPEPQPPEPPPPSTDPPAPGTTPPPAPTEPGEPTPPPVADSSRTVSGAGSASVSADDNSNGDNFFAPSSITIQVGETVTWTNNGQVTHTVTANDGSFDSGNLNPGQSFNHTFTQSGTFAYYCEPHQFVGMKGTVTVQGADSSGGPDGGSDPGSASPTAPGSESAAVASSGAAGSDTQLPSTGMPVLPLLAAGGGLLLAGALLRRRARVS